MRHRLEIIGITFNQIETGVYALILQAEGTNRRLPIIIGTPEAQAIECRLQNVPTPRPLAHDVMAMTLSEFGIELKEVEIRKLDNGIFAAWLVLTDGIREHRIDSRSSDAVALAVRMDAPLYASEELLAEAGFESVPDKKDSEAAASEGSSTNDQKTIPLESCSSDELNRLMQRAVEREDYETAAEIKRELDRRQEGE